MFNKRIFFCRNKYYVYLLYVLITQWNQFYHSGHMICIFYLDILRFLNYTKYSLSRASVITLRLEYCQALPKTRIRHRVSVKAQWATLVTCSDHCLHPTIFTATCNMQFHISFHGWFSIIPLCDSLERGYCGVTFKYPILTIGLQ